MIILAGMVGFLLALAMTGVVYLVKRKKYDPTKPYDLLVEIDGVSFVMDRCTVDIISSGAFDEYVDRRILINNMLQHCYAAMEDGWKDKHKENCARCGVTWKASEHAIVCTLYPFNLND